MKEHGPILESRDAPGPYLAIEEIAALTGKSCAAVRKHAEREAVARIDDPNDGRRLLFDLSGFPSWVRARYYERQAVSALAVREYAAPPAKAELQPRLQFAPMTETEEELSKAAPPAILEKHQSYILKWSGILGDCANGTWRRYRGQILDGIKITSNSAFIRWLAKSNGVGNATIRNKLGTLREIQRDPSVPPEGKETAFWETIVPQSPRGLSGYDFFSKAENDWMREKLKAFYLTQAKLSVKRAWELLCLEIGAKQRAVGIEHLYDPPTLRQCRTLLGKINKPARTLAREGEKAYSDRCAPYISRCPPEYVNAIRVTDQRLCNVRLRDGGNRLGRIWAVNFLDVASWRWLGCMFGPLLNSDVVMAAAAMSLERAGVPGAIHMDLGREFIGKRFLGGVFKVRGEVLFRDAIGLWERLGVKVVRAIGRNPQSKIIERWHQALDAFDQEQPGWCGSNPDERPEKLAQEEAAHERWLGTGRGYSPLLGIPEYINRYLDFCERHWNAEHHGKGRYLQGMTPNEAWNTRLPAEGVRTLSREQVDLYTSDHRKVKVARGGQLNLSFHGQTVEYQAPELFELQGEEVEVIISRRSLRRVTVICSVGRVVAEAKPLLGWLPNDREELRQALRCRAALRRAIKRGIAASQALAETASLGDLPAAAAEIAPEVSAAFAAPGPRPEQEISGAEWMSRKRPRFVNERAAAVLATMKEEGT
jgi:hypothetical protein